MTTSPFDCAGFVSPDKTWRAVPFWSWNERMEPDEVRRQVREFARAGYGGIMIHARVGLLTPYLGEEWFQCCDAAIEEAAKQNIAVWLYDEDKWPSGYGGGAVVAGEPAHRMQALTVRPSGDAAPPDCTALGEPGGDWQLYVWTSPLGHPQFNGTCYASLLDGAAIRRFLDVAYEPYAKRYGRDFGGLIPAMFTDEPSALFRRRVIHPAVPFAGAVLPAFREMFGYDPVPHLDKLFVEREGFEEFRCRYYRVVNRLFERNFTGQLAAWCEQQGIALTGHYEEEGGLYEQQYWGVDIMPNYRHHAIPGIDHLYRQVRECVTAIQCRSVAHQYGKTRVLSEVFGAAGQSITFADRKWILDQQLCLGVNCFVEHLAAYTLAGLRKRDFPPALSYQQPWWPVNSGMEDYSARLSHALGQGAYAAEFAVLHPQDSQSVYWTPEIDPGSFDGLMLVDSHPVAPARFAEIMAISREFEELTRRLLGAQRTFDYLHEALLEDDGEAGTFAGAPGIRVKHAAYPLVVMPGMITIRASTLEKLLDFAARGGKILQAGRFPHLVDGRPEPEKLRLLRERVRTADGIGQVAQVLEEWLPPAVALSSPPETRDMLWAHRRSLGGDDALLFLVNLDRKNGLRCELNWTGTDAKNLFAPDALEGKIRMVERNGSTIPLRLAPGESILFLATDRQPESADIPCPAPAETASRDSSKELVRWSVGRMDDNVLPLDCVSHQLADNAWSARPVPVIALQEYLNGRRYTGPLRLRYEFQSRLSSPRKTHLVVENPQSWEIRVNGVVVHYDGLPWWKDIRWLPIDIGPLIRPGANVVEIRSDNFRFGSLADPASDRYGTEIEPVLLVGDFSVFGSVGSGPTVSPDWHTEELPVPPLATLSAPFALCDPVPLRQGDVVTQGLPFYAGRLRCVHEPDGWARETRLTLEDLMAVTATVRVGGIERGRISWPPYSVRMSAPGDPADGGIEVVLYNSLRNLLGPHHHSAGLFPGDRPGLYTADPLRVRDPDGSEDAWARVIERIGTHPGWKHDYLFEAFGLGRTFLTAT